jgi:hypothetical protein
VHPGDATIANLEILPVAVDVQVRKVTEYLGVTMTRGLGLDDARPLIQQEPASSRLQRYLEGAGLTNSYQRIRRVQRPTGRYA